MIQLLVSEKQFGVEVEKCWREGRFIMNVTNIGQEEVKFQCGNSEGFAALAKNVEVPLIFLWDLWYVPLILYSAVIVIAVLVLQLVLHWSSD